MSSAAYVFNPALKMPGYAPVHVPAAAPDSGASQDGEGFFHRLLDVVNPLQHLPLVGTIYRAITGEHIGAVEKVAGDTLYGGLWGGVGAVADLAFESLTGKSVEDTVLALFKSDDASQVRVAAAAVPAPSIANDPRLMPSAATPALPGSLPSEAGVTALTAALSAKGVDGETATRALYAYRRSMGLAPVLASAD
jgi:hypothetical protein